MSANLPEKVSRDMGYHSDSIAISRDMGPLRALPYNGTFPEFTPPNTAGGASFSEVVPERASQSCCHGIPKGASEK